MSDTSPPIPRTVWEPNLWRRLTSVKRAREPYDAEREEGVRSAFLYGMDDGEGSGVYVPRLSAAMTIPSLNFAASTDVPVTAGCWVC